MIRFAFLLLFFPAYVFGQEASKQEFVVKGQLIDSAGKQRPENATVSLLLSKSLGETKRTHRLRYSKILVPL